MEEARRIWAQMQRIAAAGNSRELSAGEVRQLGYLWRRYVESLPPEWRNRCLVLLGGVAEAVGRSVVKLEEVADLIESSPEFRRFVVELLKAKV